MNRSSPVLRARHGTIVAVVATALALAAPASAQEILHPRAPVISFRPTPLATELATVSQDERVWFDPRLGVVTDASRRYAEITGQRLPVVDGENLREYLAEERVRRRSRLWSATIAERLSGREREAEGLIPELENPLKVPAPLARVFGEGSEFDVQGKLHMSAVGSRATQNPDLRSELLRQVVGGFDIDLDQILDLRILGTVGTKLDVAVDFNSTRELESKQLIAATYTGTEDEIVKKVEAGDIRVILPPSRFLGAGVARGTFGAQAVAQLGPVDLRLLGSRKEGQSSVRSLSIAPQGGGIEQQVTLDIKDTQYIDDRFFLLFHSDSLASQRLEYPNLGTRLANAQSAPSPGTLNVWLDDGNVTNNRENASKTGIARIDPTHPDTLPDQVHQGFFDLLIEGDDYVVTDQIIVQLKRQLDDTEVLAVSYENQGGTQVGSVQGASELELKLIKPINPDTLDFTWDYTLRNVYSLREPDIQIGSLDLTIYRGNQDLRQTFESVAGESRKYVEIFGVSDVNSRVKVPRILKDPFGGSDYLVLPSVRPFFQPFDEDGAVISIELPNRNLYFNSDGSRTALDDQVYFIEASYLSQGGLAGELELGAANIIEGSEEITMGGETLSRGTDYQIFYDFGRVVFSDPSGLAERHPNQSIDISFEVAPLFNLAPTALWGASGTWTLGENAALNSTLVMQNQESLANRPILGSEPTRTLIGTVDGTWARETPFMTRWMDALPGLETDEPSSFSVRGELAWSQPNPNTLGEVFLNDFENIDVAKRLSLFFRTWRLGSLPSQAEFDFITVADARWYTYAAQAGDITPGSQGVDQGDNLFVVHFEPEGETPLEKARSWRSIQSVISTTGEDFTRQEFIEFFARGVLGTITVDLGTVDEDRLRRDEEGIPVGVGVLDTEEADPDTRDNSLDVGEDTGLDGVSGSDVLEVSGDDGNDDFDESNGVDNFPANPNGTENNNTLDTEDDNFNGLLDRQEDALRWIVDLSDPRYEVSGSRNPLTGFRQIRLPLVTPDETLGNPDLRNVRVIRLTFSDVERTIEFELARLEIVGSTFLKRGIVAADGTPLAGQNTDSLQIASINDIENPEYESPPGVVAEQDRTDQVAGAQGVVVEQSLELIYKEILPAARGTIFRPLFDRESYIDYDRMRIWVQGRPTESGEQPEFFVAFGLDTLNVYEYGAPLLEETWEEHVIDFSVFTELKQTLLDSLAAEGATIGTRISEDGRYRVRVETTDTPAPTLTQVGQLTIGIDNTTEGPVSGSFWIDEWRLTEPVREGGAAQYVT
ncbi:MAG TPA: cell surface protein SprA, partial [Gemmatimonadota bacterium]|nr:cell surface protein SprA [Gemmatimonadota bacterium]